MVAGSALGSGSQNRKKPGKKTVGYYLDSTTHAMTEGLQGGWVGAAGRPMNDVYRVVAEEKQAVQRPGPARGAIL